ncbi:hypothetical protein HUJ04_009214 [Dendroctonus ponderosae]|nr:hypothetical protein HUJ04_009214 [Dendroctonus ponderosae]
MSFILKKNGGKRLSRIDMTTGVRLDDLAGHSAFNLNPRHNFHIRKLIESEKTRYQPALASVIHPTNGPQSPTAPMYLTKVTVRAEGAKNTRKRPGHQGRQLMHIASYNVQTLSSEAKLLEMEEELNNIKWDIVGVSEVKRRGEDQITLRSGYSFHFKEEEDSSYGGVGFFVHKKHIPNLEKIKCVSSRAPTTKYSGEEIEDFYESVRTALHATQTHFAVIIGDFDATQGFKQDNAETALGNFGYGERNERGERLLDFLHQEDVFAIKLFEKEPPTQKDTDEPKREN